MLLNHLNDVKRHRDVLRDLTIYLQVVLVVPTEIGQSFQSEIVQ